MGFDTDDPDNGADMEIGRYSDRAEIGRLKSETPQGGNSVGFLYLTLRTDKD